MTTSVDRRTIHVSKATQRRFGRRFYTFLATTFGSILFIGLSIWIVQWYHYPTTIRFQTFTSADNPDLLLPHNAFGRLGLKQLQSDLQNGPNTKVRIEPIYELTKDSLERFAEKWQTYREATVVLYFSSHGARDENGSFLFSNDPTKRLYLIDILTALKKLPQGTNKLLLLDATLEQNFVKSYILHQDFVGGIKELESQITSIPNLTVINSSSENECSQKSPELRETTFNHYLRLALQGWGDNNQDGILNGEELFSYLQEKVHNWARDHRQVRQTVIRFPTESRSITNLAKFKIKIERKRQGTEPVFVRKTRVQNKELDDYWQKFNTFSSRSETLRYLPEVWSKYTQAITRFQDLTYLEDEQALPTIRNQITQLSELIEQNLVIGMPSQSLAQLDYQLAPYSLQGYLFEQLDRLKDTKENEKLQLWQKYKLLPNKSANESLNIWLVHFFEWVLSDPEAKMPAVKNLLPLLLDNVAIRPAEIYFLERLAEDLPQLTSPPNRGQLLHTALAVKRLSEQLAIGTTKLFKRTGESIATSFQKSIQEIDRIRRQGEDLLFSKNHETLKKAYNLLKEAEQAYKQIESEMNDLHLSQIVRDQIIHSANPILELLQASNNLQGMSDLEKIYQQSIQLFQQPTPSVIASQFLNQTKDIWESKIRQYKQEMAELLRIPPECKTTRDSRIQAVQWLLKAEILLKIAPFDIKSAESFRRLYAETANLRSQLLNPPITQLKELPEKEIEEQKERFVETAFYHAKLLNLVLGIEPAIELRLSHSWTPDRQSKNLLAMQHEFSLSVAKKQAEGYPIALLLKAWTDDQLLTHQVIRKKELANVLTQQIDRTIQDAWAGPILYYDIASKYLQAHQRSLLQTKDAIDTLPIKDGDKITKLSDMPFEAKLPPLRYITDQSMYQEQVTIEQSREPAYTDGFTTAYYNGDKSESIANSDAICKLDLTKQFPVSTEINYTQSIEDITISLYARGRKKLYRIPVVHTPLPDQILNTSEPPDSSHLQFVGSPEVLANGTANAEIAFILDCSGSMRPNPKVEGDQGRIVQARNALLTILKSIPKGVRIHIWTFGRKKSDAKNAEDTIEKTIPAFTWQGISNRQLTEIESNLNAIEPWEESPIIESIIKVKNDLESSKSVNQSIILISDAEDNRISRNPRINPNQLSIRELLFNTFVQSKIRLLAITFPSHSSEGKKIQDQFKVVQELPVAGQLVSINYLQSFLRSLNNILPTSLTITAKSDDNSQSQITFPVEREEFAGVGLPQSISAKRLRFCLDDKKEVFSTSDIYNQNIIGYLSLQDNQYDLRRYYFALSSTKVLSRESIENGNWTTGILSHELYTKTNESRIRTIIEDKPHPKVFMPSKIDFAWWSLNPQEDTTNQNTLRITREYNAPYPQWNLEIKPWENKKSYNRNVRVFWFPTSSHRTKDQIDLTIQDKKVLEWQISSPVVESQYVTNQQLLKSCLAIRLTSLKGDCKWLEVEDPKIVSEIRWYQKADSVTCLFWKSSNWTVDEIEKFSSNLNLYSKNKIEIDAKKNGYIIDSILIPPPIIQSPTQEIQKP